MLVVTVVVLVVTVVVPSSIARGAMVVLVVTVVMSAPSLVVLVLGLPGRAAEPLSPKKGLPWAPSTSLILLWFSRGAFNLPEDESHFQSVCMQIHFGFH